MSELGYSFARNAYEIHVLYSDTWCDTVRSAGDSALCGCDSDSSAGTGYRRTPYPCGACCLHFQDATGHELAANRPL